MNRFYMTLFFLFFLSTNVWAINGREVQEKVVEVRVKALTRKADVGMVLFDKTGKRTRTLNEYSKKTGDNAYKVLVMFKTPPDLEDVGFLIHARSFSDRDLWAYFPEYKRIRRIPNTSQDDSFFGSDFSYDDFGGPPNIDDYSFKIIKEEEFDGKPSYVLEVTPKIRRKYTRYIAWVAKDLWIYIKIEYYQDDTLYRTGSFKDIRTITGIPTPFKLEMENKKTNHRTELTLENIVYNPELSDDMFTQKTLQKGVK
ncbi:MAG: outer membrane lipoprotein-sorting protein [Desulfobacterales bacterium]|nr:outer membrane lipoprotein-sorting protein [Desulfobacterales bacterium]